jgi:hypothetical protein
VKCICFLFVLTDALQHRQFFIAAKTIENKRKMQKKYIFSQRRGSRFLACLYSDYGGFFRVKYAVIGGGKDYLNAVKSICPIDTFTPPNICR